MTTEGIGAAACGVGGLGLPGLMWGLDKMGVEIPYWVALTVAILGVLLIAVALILGALLFYRWIKAHSEATVRAPIGVLLTIVACLLLGIWVTLLWQAGAVPSSASRLKLVQIDTRDKEDPVLWDYRFKNIGNLPAIGFIHAESSAMLDKSADESDLTQQYVILKDILRKPEWEKSTSEVQPNDGTYFTFKYAYKKSDYNQVINGPKYLYLMSLSKSRDKNSGKKWWYIETCHFQYKHQALHFCANHNSIYLAD